MIVAGLVRGGSRRVLWVMVRCGGLLLILETCRGGSCGVLVGRGGWWILEARRGVVHVVF